eukprot:TRINITY_DN8763_c0_g1_i1.p1 TRINITY_DN8763_c0_g1~~TRINITY_DN8763_c0_g1_i1.p1  ORF type:complete len:391 (-),score=110.98 TRINITY_DN8763_c0_g1_i1:26-1198(-)
MKKEKKERSSTSPEISIPIFCFFLKFYNISRRWLAWNVGWSTELLLTIQKMRSPLFDKFFLFFSTFGSELFYSLAIPAILWLADPFLSKIIYFVFTLGSVFGNMLKNLYYLPRPGDPVWKPAVSKERLDTRDYGWPSAHSINAIALPFIALRYYYGFEWVWNHSHPIEISIAYLLTTFWSGSIIWSRMYLGAHSAADIQGGMFIGAILLRSLQQPLFEYLNNFIETNPIAPLYIFLASTTPLLLHPQVRPATYTYAESSSMLGYFFGYFLGCCFYKITPEKLIIFNSPLPNDLYSFETYFFFITHLIAPITRVLLGFALAFGLLILTKPICNFIIWKIFTKIGYSKVRLPNEQDLDLNLPETISKFSGYTTLGLATTYFAPILFDILHLW